MLNDLHLFMLDQKVWVPVNYSLTSLRIDHLCNHSMCVVSDGKRHEKIIIFGGIINSEKNAQELEQSY